MELEHWRSRIWRNSISLLMPCTLPMADNTRPPLCEEKYQSITTNMRRHKDKLKDISLTWCISSVGYDVLSIFGRKAPVSCKPQTIRSSNLWASCKPQSPRSTNFILWYKFCLSPVAPPTAAYPGPVAEGAWLPQTARRMSHYNSSHYNMSHYNSSHYNMSHYNMPHYNMSHHNVLKALYLLEHRTENLSSY